MTTATVVKKNLQLLENIFHEDSHHRHHNFEYFDVVWLGRQRGYGCIANCDIPPLTLIWKEDPLIGGDLLEKALALSENDVPDSNSSVDGGSRQQQQQECQHDIDDRFLREVCEMDDRQRRRLWSMHDQYAAPTLLLGGGCTDTTVKEEEDRGCDTTTDSGSTNKNKTIRGIVCSNAFAGLDGRPALYYISAKFNHSCSPSVGYDFVESSIPSSSSSSSSAGSFKSYTMRMYTTRFVQKGDELFDCYSDVVYYFPTDVRQVYLWTRHAFLCRCDVCSGHPSSGSSGLVDDDVENENENENDTSDPKRERLLTLARRLVKDIGATFLHSPDFEEQVWKTMEGQDGDDHYDQDGSGLPKWQDANGSINYKKSIVSGRRSPSDLDRVCTPKRVHLDAILEYLDLLKELKIDHDCLDSYELAFDLAVFLQETMYLQKFQLGEMCYKLYQIRKGNDHPDTLAFQEKWDTTKRELRLGFDD